MPSIIERTLNVPVRIWFLTINLLFGVFDCFGKLIKNAYLLIYVCI